MYCLCHIVHNDINLTMFCVHIFSSFLICFIIINLLDITLLFYGCHCSFAKYKYNTFHKVGKWLFFVLLCSGYSFLGHNYPYTITHWPLRDRGVIMQCIVQSCFTDRHPRYRFCGYAVDGFQVVLWNHLLMCAPAKVFCSKLFWFIDHNNRGCRKQQLKTMCDP